MGTKTSIVKKKRYRLHCRDNTLAGMVTTPSGDWSDKAGCATSDAVTNTLEGTRGKGGRRGGKK
jgi:hypothetical protein